MVTQHTMRVWNSWHHKTDVTTLQACQRKTW